MLPSSQLILLVILIVVALVLLNWEANNSAVGWDEPPDDNVGIEPHLPNQDHNQLSS